jgi:type IV secretion system protein TrbL
MAMALPLGPVLMLKKLFIAKLGLTAAAGGGGAAAGAAGGATAGGIAAGGAATTGATAGGIAAGGAATGGGLAGSIAAGGIGAVATKAITVTAATALLAGGAVEVQHLAKPAPPPAKHAIVQPPKPAFQSGGQSAATLPSVPAVKEELKAAAADDTATTATPEDKPADTVTPDETTTTPADGDAVAPTGTTDPATVTAPEDVAPVDGQSTPTQSDAQTGGAPLPPPAGQTQSAPAAGQVAP